MDEILFDTLLADCLTCRSGIMNDDPHLLQLGKARLINSMTALLSALPPGQLGENVDAIVDNLCEQLLNLRNEVDQRLDAFDDIGTEEPPLEFNLEYIIFMRKLGMPWSKIAKEHGVSRQTLYNYRVKYKIEEPNQVISEEDLEEFCQKMATDHPKAGTGFVQSALLAEGYRASRRRVWQCLRRVDPIGTARRRRKCVTRRVYRTKGANYLWHIDSNHKLIMFRFVIHGCVDGFSRLVVHLNVATNNTGNTVLQFFKNSAEEFWLPKRVRADRGVENNRVRRYMQRKSAAKNPFIYGRSVHNTRIERLWRDVNIQVLYPFKVIFHTLEEVGILDESSNVDLWCLCYIYLPRIQHALDKFKTWWNNHTMRTMGNRTPIQMWMLKMRRQGEKSTSHIIDESDWEDDDDSDEDECNTSPLLNARMPTPIRDELQSIIPDPLADDGALGTIHYNTLRTHLLNIVSEDEAEDSS